jgi:Xaa-Pro aminopeptidase
MNALTASVPKSEIDQRIENLQVYLERNGIDAALILQNTDLFYFSGTLQRGFLYVPSQGSPILLVKKNFDRARKESHIETVQEISSAAKIPHMLRVCGAGSPKVLGLELDVLPVTLYQSIQEIFSGSKPKDISFEIRKIRSVKSPYELNLIRKAAHYSDWMVKRFGNLIEEGISEVELAGRIELEARRKGHQGLVRMRLWGAEMFYGHLMAGNSAAVPSFLASPTGGQGVSTAMSQGPGFKKIRAGEPILFDYVFVYEGYISDCTRIFSIGPPPDELLKAHEAMIQLQEKIKVEAKPGAKSGELYELAIQLASASGYGQNFMGSGDDRIRFVGHGVGLELDEFPFLAKGQSMILEKNMTLALEPKLIIPGTGVVGIENTHVVQENGLEQLTLSDEAIQIV